MHSAMNRVILDRGQHIEAGLFQAEGKTARAGEEIDSYWATANEGGACRLPSHAPGD